MKGINKVQEHYLVWLSDGKNKPRVAYTQKEALAIGDASGYEFEIRFVNEYSLQSN
jgi:hypothetical protein